MDVFEPTIDPPQSRFPSWDTKHSLSTILLPSSQHSATLATLMGILTPTSDSSTARTHKLYPLLLGTQVGDPDSLVSVNSRTPEY